MRITLKTLRRADYTLDGVDEGTKVADILDALASEHEELHRDEMSLIWSGKILREDQTLEEIAYDEKHWMVLYTKKIRQKSKQSQEGCEDGVEEAEDDVEDGDSDREDDPDSDGDDDEHDSLENGAASQTLTEAQVEELLSILQRDPACALIFQSAPHLVERMRDPMILLALLRRMGISPQDLLHHGGQAGNSSGSYPTDTAGTNTELSMSSSLDSPDSLDSSNSEDGSTFPSVEPFPAMTPASRPPLRPLPPRLNRATTGQINGGQTNGGQANGAHPDEGSSSAGPQVVQLRREEIAILEGIKDRLLEIIGGAAACPLTEGQLNSVVFQAYQSTGRNPEAALNLLINQFLQ